MTKTSPSAAGEAAGRRMDAGWFCAESVVAELAHRQGVESGRQRAAEMAAEIIDRMSANEAGLSEGH
jgi:hypothetical protein